MFKFVLICLLLRSNVRAEDQTRRTRREIDVVRYCDFEDTRRNYTAADLLQCIDKLTADFVDRTSVEMSSGKDQNGSTGRQMSFMDVFSSIFNNGATPHQGSPVPSYSTSDYQQSNHPAGTTAPSSGFQLNLLDTLSTILRHDHYKCVPRILCEMASGKLPGRSLGKQGSGLLDSLARNVFTDWLTKINVIGASPLLIFGRAMILGYGNRGNSPACYDAYPKCPKDMNGLIYYLNNYNGGFFRLFSKIRGSKYGAFGGAAGQRVDDHSKIEVRERIIAGSLKTHLWNGPVRNIVQFPSTKYQEYFKKGVSPVFDKVRSGNEIVFPDEKESRNEPGIKDVQSETPKSESNVWQKDNVAFFPGELGDRRFSRFRFPSSYTVTSA